MAGDAKSSDLVPNSPASEGLHVYLTAFRCGGEYVIDMS